MDSYLTNMHRSIGETARWARAFKARLDAGETQTSENPATGSSSTPEPLEPMMLMNYMQGLLQLMLGGSTAGAQEGFLPYYPNMPVSMRARFFGEEANPASRALMRLLRNGGTDDSGEVQKHLTGDELQELKQGLADGRFNVQQLGGAVMRAMHTAPTRYLGDLSTLLGQLLDDGQLNPTPFINEGYLKLLSDERREALSGALLSSVARQPQDDELAFRDAVVQAVTGDPASKSRAFARNLLTRAYERQKGQMDSPDGQALQEALGLAGMDVAGEGQLKFPADA